VTAGQANREQSKRRPQAEAHREATRRAARSPKVLLLPPKEEEEEEEKEEEEKRCRLRWWYEVDTEGVVVLCNCKNVSKCVLSVICCVVVVVALVWPPLVLVN